MINLHERMLQTQWGSTPQPPEQSDVHPTEPSRPKHPTKKQLSAAAVISTVRVKVCYVFGDKCNFL